MSSKIFKALEKNFVKKLFEKKSSDYFPQSNPIKNIGIERISPDWAERTCLARYKILFSDGSLKIIRGTAKVDGSKKWSYKIMKHLYENGFSKGEFQVPRPLDYIDKIGLFLYEEAIGKPFSLILQRNQYSPKFSKDIARFLFKIHSLKNIKFKKKALIFTLKDYFKTHRRIKRLFPQAAKLFPLKKIHLVQEIKEKFSFIHGDFYTGNLITRENKIILIDFDKTGQGPILYDLASFCACFEFPKSIWPLRLSRVKANKYQDAFLKSYAEMTKWDLSWLKGILNKHLAKVFFNSLNYYTGLAYEGWSVFTKKEKEVYHIQIRDLLEKINQYLKKYENFVCSL